MIRVFDGKQGIPGINIEEVYCYLAQPDLIGTEFFQLRVTGMIDIVFGVVDYIEPVNVGNPAESPFCSWPG